MYDDVVYSFRWIKKKWKEIHFGVFRSTGNKKFFHSHAGKISSAAPNKVLEHIDVLYIGIHVQPYTVIRPWLRCWGSGSHVDSNWCHYVMVEADSHLKLLPVSNSTQTKCLSTLISAVHWHTVQPYSVMPTFLGSDFWELGHLWSQNDVITTGLRLTAGMVQVRVAKNS
jgi:hypothetical protein